MKLLFLDIDGVHHTEVYNAAVWDVFSVLEYARPEAKKMFKTVIRDEFGNRFDPMTIRALKHIIDSTGAKIVISSSWRSDGLDVMQAMWKHRNLPGEVIGVTPNHMNKTGSTLQRGKEIDEYLSQHPEVESYCIIDDDTDMESHQLINFVQTDSQYGLTWNNAEKVIEILNRAA